MPEPTETQRRLALVLGAGGTAGLAYHAGALRALEKITGLAPNAADLIVGTSAGSVVASRLRKGMGTDEMWDLSQEIDRPIGRAEVFPRAWQSATDLARRVTGTAYVFSRLALPWPQVTAPAALRRRFPGGLFASDEWGRQLSEEIGPEWPPGRLYVCAVDLERRRRVVFGSDEAPKVPLARAVLASCAVPGVYPPIREAGMTLVDGGVRSTTHLDLAAGYDLVIGVVPMAFDTASARMPPGIIRQFAGRAVAAETRTARAAGSDVLLVRPTAAELRDAGRNALAPRDVAGIASRAYESTARLLETPRFRDALHRFWRL